LSCGAEEIVVSDASALADVRQAADDIMFGYTGSVSAHTGPLPLFANIEPVISQALEKRVMLKSGGFIYIEQTEACVVVDVNSGKSSGKISHAELALSINLEAARETARQIRLRNLSGMIIIDFINMSSDADKATLRRALSEELKKDRLSVTIAGMTELGLMQLTRKKTREPLGTLLRRPCPHCNGSGYIRG
jgi:ribonuclease G